MNKSKKSEEKNTHEVKCMKNYKNSLKSICFYKLRTSPEIDFFLNIIRLTMPTQNNIPIEVIKTIIPNFTLTTKCSAFPKIKNKE